MGIRFARKTAASGLSLALGLTVATGALAAPKPFVYEDLFRIDQVVDAQVSPDGTQVAVVTERRQPETYWLRLKKLWLIPTAGGTPQRVMPEDASASFENPQWSSDNSRLLYRVTKDKKSSLAVLTVASGKSQAFQPCQAEESVGTVTWSPDGQRIAAVCNGPSPLDPAVAAAQSKAEKDKGGLDSKTIVATVSKYYDTTEVKPWSPDRRAIITDVDGGNRVEVYKSANVLDEPGALQWRQPGSLWIVATPKNEFGGMTFAEGRVLIRHDLKTGKTEVAGEVPGTQRMPLLIGNEGRFLAPLGGTIATAGPENFRKTWELENLDILEVAGRQKAKTVASREMFVPRSAPFLWVGDGSSGSLYFQWLDKGSNRIKVFHPDRQGEAQWEDLTRAGLSVATLSASADGSTLITVRGDANTPNEVYVQDLSKPDSQARAITSFGKQLRQTYQVSNVDTVSWRSGDDRFDVGGWLVKPADFKAGKRYPLILLVHGGPGVAFRNTFDAMHFEGAHQVPPELYLSRGYVVLMINPRGDPGYGKLYQEALLEGWDYPTRHDLITGVQEMVRRGIADPQRLGIAGASYGGWVTAFAVTQTDIFKAASAHDPVIDTQLSSSVAYRGNLLTNYWMHSGFVDNHVLDAPFPTSDPRKVQAPILLRFGLRGEGPLPSQFFVSGLEYFTYLHAHCKPVEMILHPEEGHGIGDGEALKDYVQRDAAWFDYWLLGKGTLPYKPHKCYP